MLDSKDEQARILEDAISAIDASDSLESLQAIQVQYLGKSGLITSQLKTLGKLSPEEKKAQGQAINAVKQSIISALNEKRSLLEQLALEMALQKESIDVTLPGRSYHHGSSHPLTIVEEKLRSILLGLGYEWVKGPEIEDDYHNFEALNFPPNHPARDMQDTLFLDKKHLLRTHTSSVQIRALNTHKPPLAIISSGKVFRSDTLDATHSPVFNQLEGLRLGDDITFSDLKSMIISLLSAFFGYEVKTRFRPSYFPFTEPSAEVDLYFKGEWLEVMGCGMVHPNVLEKAGIDSSVQGYAFGLGIERLTMMSYGISDIRDLYRNDIRLLKQFHAPVRLSNESQ